MPFYLTVTTFTLVGFAFVASTLFLAGMLRPRAPNPNKLETYECGPLPIGDAWRQFNMHYYLYALLFVVFDVEAAFLFPWALVYRQVGAYAVAEVFIFVGILLFALVCVWRRGALEWE